MSVALSSGFWQTTHLYMLVVAIPATHAPAERTGQQKEPINGSSLAPENVRSAERRGRRASGDYRFIRTYSR
jgi:hypothetical protein